MRQASMELAYGILLDQNFLCGFVHAALVNMKWYEKWWERTLFVDPIINDVPGLCVLTRKQHRYCRERRASCDLHEKVI